jgi:hypothetical protein
MCTIHKCVPLPFLISSTKILSNEDADLSIIKMWELQGLSLPSVDGGEEIKREIYLLNGTLFRKWSGTIKGILGL